MVDRTWWEWSLATKKFIDFRRTVKLVWFHQLVSSPSHNCFPFPLSFLIFWLSFLVHKCLEIFPQLFRARIILCNAIVIGCRLRSNIYQAIIVTNLTELCLVWFKSWWQLVSFDSNINFHTRYLNRVWSKLLWWSYLYLTSLIWLETDVIGSCSVSLGFLDFTDLPF